MRERLLTGAHRCDPRARLRERSVRRLLQRQLPLAAEVIAAHVRAGRSLTLAISDAADDLPEPIRSRVASAAAELALGAAPADALVRLGGSADVRLMAEAVRLQGRAGGDMAELLDGLARLLHARAAERRAAEVATAQARYTGRLVTLMPAFGLAALYLVDRPGLQLLAATWAGRAALVVSALLAVAGHAMIGRIAAVAE